MSSPSRLAGGTPAASVFRRRRILAALALAVLVLGGLLVRATVLRTDQRMRDDLLAEASFLAGRLPQDVLGALTGTAADAGTPAYRQQKEGLGAVQGSMPGCRFIYLLGRDPGGTVFFRIDSEPEGSPDLSPPGQPYEEAGDDVHRAFTGRQAVVTGPYDDRWGTWVTALVPLPAAGADEATPPAAILGLDIDASAWRSLLVRTAVPDAVAVLLLLAIVTLVWLLRRRAALLVRSPEALAVVAVGLVATAWWAVRAQSEERRDLHQRFLVHGETAARRLADRLEDLVGLRLAVLAAHCRDGLGGAAGFELVAGALAHGAAVQAWEWVPAVEAAGRPAVEAALPVGIWERDGDGRPERAGQRASYYPVAAVHPVVGNRRALGFDLGSEPVRRQAIERVLATGRATVSDPVTLVQEGGSQRGMLVLAPVPGEQGRLRGFVLAVLRVGCLLRSTVGGQVQDSVELGLLSRVGDPVRLAAVGVAGAEAPSVRRSLLVAGRAFAVGSRLSSTTRMRRPSSRWAGSTAGAGASAGGIGRRAVKVEPNPSTLAAVRLPPINSVMRRQITRPRPVPPKRG